MSAQTLPNGKRYWLGRDEWLAKARAMQKRGLTMTEIAEQLDLARPAVVQALYWEVVGK